MDLNIEKLKDAGRKTQAIALSVGLGISAAAGVAMMDDNPVDSVDSPDSIDTGADAPKEVGSQIDENRNKLDTMAASNDNQKTNYTLLGC